MDKLETIFIRIREILEQHAANLEVNEADIVSQKAKAKPSYQLYGQQEISIAGKKPQKTYVGGVIQQKNYVSFYLSPMYSHPELRKQVSPELMKFLKGKTCFNINKATPDLYKEIAEILALGIQIYQDLNWL